jgi:hypothetical protein
MIGEVRNACSMLVAKSEKKRDHLGDLGLDGRITLAYNVSYRIMVD